MQTNLKHVKERGFSAYKNLHTLLRNTLGEGKVDDLMFIQQNGPEVMSPEADQLIADAVVLFQNKKPRRFDSMNYGKNPHAKSVRLGYQRKSRKSHVESQKTSLKGVVTQQEEEGAATLFNLLVQEGSAAADEKRQARNIRRQQSQVERNQASQAWEGHEPGSIAQDRQEKQREANLEREGKFLVTSQPQDESGTGRPRRAIKQIMTAERLLAIAHQPTKSSKKSSTPRKQPKNTKQGNPGKAISSFFSPTPRPTSAASCSSSSSSSSSSRPRPSEPEPH